jgi:hypothetical protein
MKRRVIETRKILAVALGAAAGCTSATGGDLPAAGVSAPPAQMAETQSPPVTAAAPASPPVERRFSQDPALLALREALSGETRGKVQNPDRFRPLCDKDGYPMVGNMMRKSPNPYYQPSAFCADLRAQAKR